MDTTKTKKSELAKYGLVAMGGGAALALMEMPANATTAPVQQVENQATAINGIITAIVPVALAAMAFRIGVKMFNRISVKG